MDNSSYFNDLKFNIQIENNNKEIKYLKELINIYEKSQLEIPISNWDSYKKYDNIMNKLNKKITTLAKKIIIYAKN